jgi:hypothetical protein
LAVGRAVNAVLDITLETGGEGLIKGISNLAIRTISVIIAAGALRDATN